MPQSLEALESLLIYHGGSNPPSRDPAKRHSIRSIIEVTIGQFIGFFVAVWCIFRSVDSMFAPRYRPHDDSFVFVPPALSSKQSSSTSNGSNNISKSERNSTADNSKQPGKKTGWSARSSKSKPSDKQGWAPRAYSCKIVDIRSKQTGTAIARLGSSKKASRDSNGELRRRLIEFTIETRSKPLDSFLAGQNGTGVFSTLGEDPAMVMASGFHQMGLGNASGNSKDDTEKNILAGKVIRRQADCEMFRSQVLGGAIPLAGDTKAACVSIFNNADMEPTSTTQEGVTPTRRRYLGFTAASAANGSELDLSGEMNLCSQLESVLNMLLHSAATREQPPHDIICDFLGISSSVHSAKPSRKQLSVKTSDSESDSISDKEISSQLQSKKQSSHRRGGGIENIQEGAEGASLVSSPSVDSLKGMERASMMPEGVKIPLPPKSEWPDYPILVRCSEDTEMKIGLGENVSAYGALPINNAQQPIPFETSLFKGVAMIRIADLSTSPADYFAGKRRKMQVCVQGQFKKPLRYDQVFGGQEFSGGLRNIPGKWLIKWAFELLKPRLPKSFEADLFGPTPYFLSPLVLTAQKMRADQEGEAQPVTDHEILEEMGLILGEKYIGKNDDKGRKKAFSGAGALSSTCFDTNLVYTFDYFQQFLRSDQFALDLGVKLLDLSHYLGEQPLLLTMAKDMESGEYLWKFELWHERCVPLDKSRPNQ